MSRAPGECEADVFGVSLVEEFNDGALFLLQSLCPFQGVLAVRDHARFDVGAPSADEGQRLSLRTKEFRQILKKH